MAEEILNIGMPVTGPTPREQIESARGGAAWRLTNKKNCRALFGNYMRGKRTNDGRRVEMNAAGEMRSASIEISTLSPGVAGGHLNGTIWLQSGGGFFTGFQADRNGKTLDLLKTNAFKGLSNVGELRQAFLIHELLHLLNVVGPDNNNQTIRLPNGSVVQGTTGVSQEVVKQCF